MNEGKLPHIRLRGNAHEALDAAYGDDARFVIAQFDRVFKRGLTFDFAPSLPNTKKKAVAPPKTAPVLKAGEDPDAFAAAFFAGDEPPVPRPADTDPNIAIPANLTNETLPHVSATEKTEPTIPLTPDPVAKKPMGDASKSAEHLLNQVLHPSRRPKKP